MRRRCIIVGSGQAGARAAVSLRAAGFSGRIVLIGDEPDLPYERPPLSKAVLKAPDNVASPPVLSADRWETDQIELKLGARAEDIDTNAARVRLSNGETLAYDQLILATGGAPRPLEIEGASRVHYLRTIGDAHVLRQRLRSPCRVVCVGAGVVSLEVASSARALGCHVTVIEIADRVMQRAVPPEISERFARLHRIRGVNLKLGATIATIRATGSEEQEVVCADGENLTADVVIAGIGMIRNEGLASRAGIATGNGIFVDPWGRTSAANVFAAGDATAFWHPRTNARVRLETWKHAQDHGIAVGTAAATDCASEPYSPIPWFWSEQHGQMMQVAGFSGSDGQTVEREHDNGYAIFHIGADGELLRASTINDPRTNRAAQAVMARGGRIDAAALADPARDAISVLKAAAKQAAGGTASSYGR